MLGVANTVYWVMKLDRSMLWWSWCIRIIGAERRQPKWGGLQLKFNVWWIIECLVKWNKWTFILQERGVVQFQCQVVNFCETIFMSWLMEFSFSQVRSEGSKDGECIFHICATLLYFVHTKMRSEGSKDGVMLFGRGTFKGMF